ncbi:hypothetical protein HPHPP1_0129 [Helicobacter pylori Hp P-1]|nr:hypothetical protein HPHPP1_0129 [Helicobacter pylori Hp P-1]EJC19065.1 hypothetical protein HPHPP1B_1710 [Helicobacter pylori Hp P-1b]
MTNTTTDPGLRQSLMVLICWFVGSIHAIYPCTPKNNNIQILNYFT